MRCPKCGYISFDQAETCAKCDATLADVGKNLAGTGVEVKESFFLSSILKQGGKQETSEEMEFDLADAESAPDTDVEIELSEGDEEIPVVDLTPFEQPEEAAAEEEGGIDFSLPGEGGPAEKAEVSVAEEEEVSDVQGTIDFSLGEEAAKQEEPPALEEAEGLDLSLEEAGGEEALEELGGEALELEEEEAAAVEAEESLPELELEMGAEAEETAEAEPGLPDLEEESMAEEPSAEETVAAKGPGLDLDIDVNLEEDEPADEELVFNLEDIDMSDLVIEGSGEEEEEDGRPEDTAVDLEDFLSSGKESSKKDVPMDLTMEDVGMGEGEQDKKKSGDVADLEL